MARRGVWVWAAVAVTAAGAALRFATLGVQSFWLDEAVTHQLVTRSLGGMLRAIPHSESTPPLYYVLAWSWAQVFGAGEAGLRSLSALFGVATIVLIATIARRVGGNRAALAAAALAATNPLLIWYSQEARAYALLVMLAALSLWCLQRGAWRSWALAAALALATHYFAVFIVVPELAWLVWHHARTSRAAAISAAAVVVVAAALAPLAIVQAGGRRANFIASSGLGGRIAAVPKQLLIGYGAPHQAVLTVLAAVAAAALAAGVRREDRRLLVLAALALGVPLVLALAGADYLITRNLIAALVPLLALGGVAAARTRAGLSLAGALAVLGVVTFVLVETDVRYQRDDWRGAARAIAAAGGSPRAIVVEPASGATALRVYLPARTMPASGSISTAEIDIVDLRHDPPKPTTTAHIDGYKTAQLDLAPTFTFVRYGAATPVTVTYPQLVGLRLEQPSPAVLTQP